MELTEILAGLRAEQDAANTRMTEILSAAGEDEKRSLTDDETAEFDRLDKETVARTQRVSTLEGQIKRNTEAKERDERAAATVERHALSAPATVTREEQPYTADSAFNHGNSFFRDLWRAGKGDQEASQRLQRNNAVVAAEDKTRAINTTFGAGGEFVPPLWLEDQFVKLARPGRPFANLVQNDKLPSGTDSINIPKVNTGTAVAIQGTQNTAIQQTDLTTTSINSAVFTIAGGQTASMQLVEQSPLNVDKIILGDLAQAYGVAVDVNTLSGAGGAGAPTGVLTLAGTTAVAYTTATPTFGGTTPANSLYSKIQSAIQSIQTTRYASPTAIVMHPRRWAWICASVDTQGRPIVLPSVHGLVNALGKSAEQLSAEGYVGEIAGLPVVTDASVPTNTGAGTNQDPVVVLKADDLWLWESNIKLQAFEQTFAQNVSLFFRAYNYISFQAARYPASIAVINGTGNVPPVF